MKLLLLHNYYKNPGGEDSVFAAEFQLLLEKGHKVITYTDNNSRLYKIGSFHAARQTLWASDSYRKISQIIQKEKPDIAHFHNTFPLISPAAYYACKKAGVAVIQTLHNYRLACPAAIALRSGKTCQDCFNKFFPWPAVWHRCYHGSFSQTFAVSAMLAFHRLLETWQKQVDAYIALTEFAKCKLASGGLPNEKIFVKPNFVSDPGGIIEKGRTYAVFAGRLSPEKGIMTLLDAWRIMNNGIGLKIAGAGPLEAEIKQFIKTHRLKHVELLGHCGHNRTIDLIKRANFLIFPSVWFEAFPVSLVEAFACGTPVIAASIGVMPELIRDGKTGLLFNPADPSGLAEKIKWLWKNPGKQQELGNAARQEYTDKYTPEKNFGILMSIYDSALKNNADAAK
ncbi:MAG: glycosyltransferase family 4 protein [Candidatus Omnitrophota bacterium]